MGGQREMQGRAEGRGREEEEEGWWVMEKGGGEGKCRRAGAEGAGVGRQHRLQSQHAQEAGESQQVQEAGGLARQWT